MNRYNQVSHLNRGTLWKVAKPQGYIKHNRAICQQVNTMVQETDKAV